MKATEINKTTIIIGSVLCAIGIILGAFGAHALQNIVPDPKYITSWESGVRYQMYHGIAILIIAILRKYFQSPLLSTATMLMLVGILLFSGSIYLLVFLKSTATIGLGGLGIITPIGGVILILAWLLLIVGVIKSKN